MPTFVELKRELKQAESRLREIPTATLEFKAQAGLVRTLKHKMRVVQSRMTAYQTR